MRRDDVLTYTRSAVAAYQEDLERVGEKPFLRSRLVDSRWLRDAIWLERRAFWEAPPTTSGTPTAGMPPPLRARFRGKRLNASILDGASGLERGVGEVLQRAEEMEANGGLSLALSLISAARAIWIDHSPFGATLALVQMGRIARTVGDHAAAWTLYENADRDARRLGFGAARARAMLGQGAIHYEAGRVAEARLMYRAAARVAGEIPTVRSMAWLGLSSIAHREGDAAASFDLGLRALRDAPESAERRAEVVVNMAYAALRVGRPAAALGAAQWVLRRRVHERSRCLAIAAAALAAAGLGRQSVLRKSVTLARRATSAASLPYPVALMWAFLARAEAEAGLGSESRGAARRARLMAARHGFDGIQAEADRLLPAGVASPAVSGQIVERLELALAEL